MGNTFWRGGSTPSPHLHPTADLAESLWTRACTGAVGIRAAGDRLEALAEIPGKLHRVGPVVGLTPCPREDLDLLALGAVPPDDAEVLVEAGLQREFYREAGGEA